MIGSIESRQLYLYTEPTDMRKSFNGLTGIVTNELGQEVGKGDAFIFINKRRDKIKILVWDMTGYVIYYKRLEQGTFELPAHHKKEKRLHIDRSELLLILEGIQLQSIRRRKRYTPAVNS